MNTVARIPVGRVSLPGPAGRRPAAAIVCCMALLGLLGVPGGARAADLVRVTGLDGELLDNALAYLGYATESCDSPEWRLQSLYARGPKRIRESLEAYGYYDPVITADSVVADGCRQAVFTVERGEPVRYRRVNVTVADAGAPGPWRSVLAANPLRTGEVLRHADYDNYKQRFNAIARRYGYFDSTFTASEILVYPEEQAADINLNFAPGTRYRYGEVRIDQDVVTDELVRRFVEFRPGEPFDADAVAELYDSLLLTNYFATLNVRSVPRDDGSHIADVSIDASAAKPTTWSAGLGFGTDTGPQVRLGYLNRRANLKGHQWGVSGSASRVIKQAGINYRIPLTQPRAEWLSFDGGYRDEDTDTLVSKQVKVGVKRLQRRGTDWLETQFFDIADERYTVGEESGDVFYLAPGISWSRSENTGIARPSAGHSLSFRVSGTAEAIGSDLSFVQGVTAGKIIRSLPFGIRALARVEAGTTWVDDFQELPASLRFFAGGDFSVRGYDYKTLGPADSTGEVVGGDNLLTFSVEVDRLVRNNWALAAFVDGGNAFDKFSDMDLKFGVGGGVRWFSPVGPIRFDVAFPLADDATDDFRVHITLSPDL